MYGVTRIMDQWDIERATALVSLTGLHTLSASGVQPSIYEAREISHAHRPWS